MPTHLIVEILSRTPPWVWLLLAALVALGVSQARTRRLPVRRIVALPAVLLALSLGGVATAFHGSALLAALGAFGIGVAAALAVGRAGPLAVRGAHWLPEAGRLQVPGSWLPLVLILALFALKYGVNVALAMNPRWAQDAGVAASIGLAYGCFSGLFLARAASIWALVPAAGSRGGAPAGA